MPPEQKSLAELVEPYESLSSLRAEHISKMREAQQAGRSDEFVLEVRKFIDRVRATGRRLDASSDRETAQNVIAYWASFLFKGDEPEALSAALPELDPFDPASAPDASSAENPYKGLSAFDEGDANAFYGREAAANQIVEKLHDRPVVLVIGPMGGGKTSFVMAGLVPKLKSRMIHEEKNPALIAFTPGVDPFVALLVSLRAAHRANGGPKLDMSSAWISEQKKKLERAPEQLRVLLDAVLPGASIILVVDHFEEIFTLGVDAAVRDKFAKALVSACPGGENPNRAMLIIDKRSEQSALQLAGLKPLEADPESRFTLPPLTPDEVRRIIEDPAKAVGLRFDDGIVDDIVKDIAGDAGALPALQFTLGKLWDERSGNLITWDIYSRVGRPREALQRTAEKSYGERTPSEKDCVKRLFLELVHPTAEGGFARRRVRRDAVFSRGDSDEMALVLDAFVKVGLIRQTPGAAPEDDCFDLAHEVLITSWPRLREWLLEESVASEKKLQFVALARRWRDAGATPDSGYLLSNDALNEAEAFVGADRALDEFIKASRSAAKNEERRKQRMSLAGVAILGILTTVAVVGWVKFTIEEQAAVRAEKALSASERMLRVLSSELQDGNIKVKAARNLLIPTNDIFAMVVDSAELTGTRAEVTMMLSDLNLLVGDREKALEYALSVKELAQEFLTQDHDDVDWRRRLFGSSFRIGDLKAHTQQLDDALNEYQRALQIAKDFATASPDDFTMQRNVAFIENKIGDIFLMQRKWEQGLEHYRASLSIGQELLTKEPNEPEPQKVVADARKRIGDLLARQKRFSEATAEYDAALAIQKRLVEKEPDNAVYQSNLAKSYHQLGEVYRADKKVKEALQEYEKALVIRNRLAQADPDNTEWQVALGREHISMGDAAKTIDSARTINHYHKALAVWKELASKELRRIDWPLQTATSHIKLADVLFLLGNVDAAMAEYRSAVAIQKKLAEKYPDKASVHAALANSYDEIGVMHKKENQTEAALENYRKALEIRSRLVAQDPDDKELRRSLAGQLMAVADMLYARDPKGAIEHYREALGFLEKTRDQPPDLDWKRMAATAREGTAAALIKQHKAEAAVAEARMALQSRIEILGQSPESRESHLELALSYKALGDAQRAQANERQGALPNAESAAAYQKALDIIEGFMREHPDSELESVRGDLKRRLRGLTQSGRREGPKASPAAGSIRP